MVASKKKLLSSSNDSGGTSSSVPQLPDIKPAVKLNNSEMSAFKAFKPRKLRELTESETAASVDSWQQNVEFHVASCEDFAPFLEMEWAVKSVPNRGLESDEAGTNNSKTAAQKFLILKHMLGLITSFCPQNIRLEIDRKNTSLKWFCYSVSKYQTNKNT